MTPPLTEFMAGLEREQLRRELVQKKERLEFLTVNRNPAQEYRSYRCEIFSRTVAQRKGER
jgi:hypothetical protein